MRGLRKSKRSKPPRHRLDMTAMKEALLDGRIWTGMGLVKNGDDGNYFEFYEDDILIDVELMPNEEHIQARLGCIAGGTGAVGIWGIPSLGSEVAVLVPTGELEFGASIVAVLSSGALPDGIEPNVTVFANGKVLVHDGAGGAEPLCKKSEFDGHKHSAFLGGTGSVAAQTSVPSSDGAGTPAPIVGTEVLESK